MCRHLIPSSCNHTPQLTSSAPDMPASSAPGVLPPRIITFRLKMKGGEHLSASTAVSPKHSSSRLTKARNFNQMRFLSHACRGTAWSSRHPLAHVIYRELEKVAAVLRLYCTPPAGELSQPSSSLALLKPILNAVRG